MAIDNSQVYCLTVPFLQILKTGNSVLVTEQKLFLTVRVQKFYLASSHHIIYVPHIKSSKMNKSNFFQFIAKKGIKK